MEPDLAVSVGSLRFPNPLMAASGTAGHGAELNEFFDLSTIGAVVVKSLSPEPWAGNPPLRVHETTAGMLNSVGLQGPGVAAWLERELPALQATGARIVVSIWGRTIDDYRRAAEMLADAPAEVVAVEINASCPNLDDGKHMFAQSTSSVAAVVEATTACNRPRWVKLTPVVNNIAEIAGAAQDAGADAVTLINTLLGMAIDVETRKPVLGAGGGGLSGPAIHPVAVRAVHETRAARPDLPIVGVGGVASPEGAVELLLAGANAVQVGTATFADPRALPKLLRGMRRWCQRHDVRSISELSGGAHV